MDKKTEAMKLALEALVKALPDMPVHTDWHFEAITALREALAEQPAQQEQEPVVFYRCNGCGHAYEQVHPTSCDCMEGSSFEKVNYYTSPQPAQQKPWGVCVSGRVFIGALPEYVRKLSEDEGLPIQWLYTSPPAQRKPLTYVDLRRIAHQCGLGANEVSARTQATVDNFARAIEAAHGIKENT